ncbi:MAG: hypothetical protein EBT51_05585 [Flavobacteriaceae bacterium]|nr:hypothetical protein [Flavobacteriaceae bacterium]
MKNSKLFQVSREFYVVYDNDNLIGYTWAKACEYAPVNNDVNDRLYAPVNAPVYADEYAPV